LYLLTAVLSAIALFIVFLAILVSLIAALASLLFGVGHIFEWALLQLASIGHALNSAGARRRMSDRVRLGWSRLKDSVGSFWAIRKA
jgi:hypothetical protein